VTPPAALVICAYNDADYVEKVVRAAVEQELPGREIIVVDDASTDGTPQILERIPGIRLLRNEINMGLAASLTRGVASTDAPIVFSLHSDCLLRDAGWMSRMVALFDDPAVGAVVSRRVYPDRASLSLGSRLFDVVCPQYLNPKGHEAVDIDFFRGKADAYRREVVDRLGGWDRAFFTAGEDTDLSIKMRAAGYRILLHPEATVEYIFSSRQNTIGGGIRKATLYGRTAALLYRRHRYDGLQTRSYLWCLLGMLSALLPLPARLASSAALLATSFNRLFSVHCLRRQVPLAVLHLAALLAFVTASIAAGWDTVSASSWAVPAASLFFTSYISMKNASRAIRDGENPLLLPLLFGYAFAWHLASGVGYAVGFLRRPRGGAK